MALTDIKIRNTPPQVKPRKLFDSGGLFLLVNPSGSRWWRLKYRVFGKEKSISLGDYLDVTLAKTRERRDAARSLHHLGEMDAAIAAGASWANAAPSIESKSYLALLHMDGGDMQVGNRLGLEVLQQDASNVDANVVVGSASMEHQQADRARACFDIALKRDPENGRA